MRFAEARSLTARGRSPRRGPAPKARGRQPRALVATVAGLAVVSLATACQGGGSANGQPTVSGTITVAAIRGIDTTPLYIAHQDGAFAHAGLRVKVISYSSVAAEFQALIKGHVDIASGDYVDFFALAAKSAHPYLSIVADAYHAGPGVMEVLTYPGSGITTPQQLADRTIATPAGSGIIPQSGSKPYSLETLATQSVLTSDGVNPDQVTWRPMPASSLITELAEHKVSAILVDEPEIFKAESTLGAYAVLDSCSGATANLPLSGYFALSAFANQRPAALAAFRRVLLQAQKAAVLPGPVRAELASSGMDMQTASLVTIGSYPTSLDAASLQRVADLMFNFEILDKAINVSGMIAGAGKKSG